MTLDTGKPQKDEMIYDEIEVRAKRIAAAANECCHRSDGFEEAIEALALKELREACAYAQE